MSTVARLRQLVTSADSLAAIGIGTKHLAVASDDLAALLDVVERFAASEPVLDIEVGCVCCDGHYNDGPDGVGLLFDGHLPDCPWLVARRLCGMGDADAS